MYESASCSKCGKKLDYPLEAQHGHPKFYELTKQEEKLHSDKNFDYAAGGNPLGNFDRVAAILALYPKLKLSDPEVVALIYLLKQLDAVLWNLSNQHELKVEGRSERYQDISVYSKLANIIFQEDKNTALKYLKKPIICYLDMDGVLTNFNKAATAIIGATYPPTKWYWYEDIENGFERVNKACDAKFWQNLEWMPDGKKILKTVENFFSQENIYIVTAPMKNPEAPTGKIQWIQQHLPEYQKRLIITVKKAHLARPGVCLIDDRDKNCNEFIEAGGKAILVPRPWNCRRNIAEFAVNAVKNGLEEILNESCSRNR